MRRFSRTGQSVNVKSSISAPGKCILPVERWKQVPVSNRNSRSLVSPISFSPSIRQRLSSKRMGLIGAMISPPSTQNAAKRVMPVMRQSLRSEKLQYHR